jgi:TolA-binding protein
VVIDWALIGPLVVGLIAAVAGWVTTRIQHRGKPENALIDQLQEELLSMRKDITDLKLEQAQSRRRERIRDDYINQLRQHIADQKPPPAPEWPKGLYD